VLSEVADVTYKCTHLYEGSDDRGIVWNDPRIGIDWPSMNPVVSAKDAGYEGLSESRTDLPRFS
jgi:dTDP-4-dehydrorhamnose 3,5-epimerase